MKFSLNNFRKNIGPGELWALGSAIAYSLDNVFSAIAVRGQELNFSFGASLRSIPVFLFSLVMIYIVKKDGKSTVSPLKDWKIFTALAGNGILTFFIGNTLFFAALQAGGVLITTPVAGTQILWAAIFAGILLGEKLNYKMVLGMVVSICGILVLAVGRSGDVNLASRWWLAIPYALGAAICWSSSGVLIAYAMRRGVDRFQALLVGIIVGNATIHFYLILSGQAEVYTTTPLPLMFNVIAAGLFNMFALVSITTALGLTSVDSASTLNALQVGLAPIMAALIIHEDLNAMIGAGILLILTGVLIVQLTRETIRI